MRTRTRALGLLGGMGGMVLWSAAGCADHPAAGIDPCAPAVVEGCAPSATGGDGVYACTLRHGGAERSYRLTVPDPACGPSPLVFDLHGLTSNPEQEEWITGFGALGRQEGFVTVQPAGAGGIASWNAGSCCGQAAREQTDDVGLLDAIRARVAATIAVDPARVYATGLSNGGYLAHRLACERADVYAAIAPVAGVLGVERCDSARPVPVLQLHGTDDALVPFAGGGLGGGLSAPATVQWWADRNACGDEQAVTFAAGSVTCARHEGCAAGADVELCVVEGGGHSWPGGPDLMLPALGATSPDLDATRHAWDFFAAHALPVEPAADWTPRQAPEVPEERVADAACVAGETPFAATRRDARLVLVDDEAPPPPTGGDPTGRWSLDTADLYLPPIATEQLDAARSLVQAAGRVELGADGQFVLVLDLDGTLVTASYGALHLRRRVRATGTWTTDGTELVLTATCGGAAGSPGEAPARAGFSRLDDARARIGWVVSSGLIGDVSLVVTLSRAP